MKIHADAEVVREVMDSGDVLPSRDYVIIVGEEPKASAPSLTLAKALARLGVGVRFTPPDRLGRREWVRLLRSAKAILLVSYNEVDVYLLSQLATAVAMDVPIIRWWVGTDVLNAITRKEVQRSALHIDSIVSANVAVAPHLVDELATIGIQARFVPSVLDPGIVPLMMESWSERTRPVLLYLPDRRKEFYGLGIIEPVIASNPDIDFIVVADQTHSLSLYPNVESLGWVTDMRALYGRAGCILRITAHDGLPRMLMEALLRGLYAIYSWPLEGCWEAHTEEEISEALIRYRATRTPNVRGRDAVLEMLSVRPDEKMSGVISDASVALPRRVHAMGLAVRTKVFPEQFR